MTAPVPAQVRRGRPGHSLDSLLDVAVAVFNERGYEATSMDVLADRLGVTKSAIYHHVRSKVELLELALDRALDGLFAVLASTGEGPAVDRLEQVVRGSVGVLVAELPFVTLLLRVRGNSPSRRTHWAGGASSTERSPSWCATAWPRGPSARTSTPR
ncbi:TetR/AcrR family transcriptional regulator [Klenkia terrae]|uniref:TetR/AcrR family transcriptional regulator n=1 Tax=Klenkia terrae TaxID=1052259 RepID=UPI003616929A